MNATLKPDPCPCLRTRSEAKRTNMEESQHALWHALGTLEIGRRKNDAASIGLKQVPREPGCDGTSQPASEEPSGIYLEALQSLVAAEV